MEMISSLVVGAAAGGLTALLFRPINLGFSTSMAVGILGALLGLAANFWLTAGGLSSQALGECFASGAGALVVLLLWVIAQRLFLGTPSEKAISD